MNYIKKFFKKAIKYFLEFVVIRGILMPLYFLECHGISKIPDGPCIISGNHKSNMDPIFLTGFFSDKIRFIGKKELSNSCYGRFATNVFDIILIDRKNAGVSAMKEAFRSLKDGKALGIFPEGTRNGVFKGVELKDGIIDISVKRGVPVIPCSISGKMKPFSRNNIVLGDPIYFKEEAKKLGDITDENVRHELIQMLWSKVVSNMDEKDKEKYTEVLKKGKYNFDLGE